MVVSHLPKFEPDQALVDLVDVADLPLQGPYLAQKQSKSIQDSSDSRNQHGKELRHGSGHETDGISDLQRSGQTQLASDHPAGGDFHDGTVRKRNLISMDLPNAVLRFRCAPPRLDYKAIYCLCSSFGVIFCARGKTCFHRRSAHGVRISHAFNNGVQKLGLSLTG